MGQLSSPAAASGAAGAAPLAPGRVRALQRVGVLCGIAAGAWLGAAEVPTKLVTTGISPVLISFLMVAGVFLGRWSLPAIMRGTSGIRADIAEAPHLVIWAIIAGCLWSVANTLTIFAIRDLGLSVAFPLWNTNALIGILWGVLFFRELHHAGWRRWSAVCGGALVMFLGGMLLARASSSQIASHIASHGIAAALGAGVLWGTMYIPYRKAYLSGMNPLSFVSFFTIGELGRITALKTCSSGCWPPALCGSLATSSSNTRSNMSASAAAFPSPTPINSGACCGELWPLANFAAGSTARLPALFGARC